MMPKIVCARFECKHNKGNVCKAKKVVLRSWGINTVHQGFKKMEECKTFEPSEEFLQIQKIISEGD